MSSCSSSSSILLFRYQAKNSALKSNLASWMKHSVMKSFLSSLSLSIWYASSLFFLIPDDSRSLLIKKIYLTRIKVLNDSVREFISFNRSLNFNWICTILSNVSLRQIWNYSFKSSLQRTLYINCAAREARVGLNKKLFWNWNETFNVCVVLCSSDLPYLFVLSRNRQQTRFAK